MLVLFALYLLAPAASPPQRQQSAVVSRACAANWNAATATRKKKSKRAAANQQTGAACVEISSSALDVQEILQEYVRNLQWKILDEDMNEDFWQFSFALSKEKLVESTKPEVQTDKVAWRSGIAIVQVTTTRLPDGFTRTIIRATFRGYGESEDQFAMQREYWDLPSNGSLEASLVSILKEHFKGTT
jgi:hypothetical protein